MTIVPFSFSKVSLMTLSTFRAGSPRSAMSPPRRTVSDVSGSGTGPAASAVHDAETAEEEETLVQFAASWPPSVEPELRARTRRAMRVLARAVSAHEEEGLLEELEPVLRRMRYQYDHWDNAIHGYRETERGSWRPHNERVLERVRAAAWGGGGGGGGAAPLLPHAHVLDLAAGGHIKPHVDAVRFCGATIAGLSLCSAAVMRLVHSSRSHLALDALLPRRSLYIMTGVARYSFTHAVLGGAESHWRGERVTRQRRVAVIMREAPTDKPQPHPLTDLQTNTTLTDC